MKLMNSNLFSLHPALKGWVKKGKASKNNKEVYIESSKYQSTKLQPKPPYKTL